MTTATRNHGEVNRIIGVYIRATRETKGWSQRDLGARMGITPAAVCKLEAGHTVLRVDRMLNICDYLGISPVDMMADIARLTANVPRETSTGDQP